MCVLPAVLYTPGAAVLGTCYSPQPAWMYTAIAPDLDSVLSVEWSGIIFQPDAVTKTCKSGVFPQQIILKIWNLSHPCIRMQGLAPMYGDYLPDQTEMQNAISFVARWRERFAPLPNHQPLALWGWGAALLNKSLLILFLLISPA